MIRRKESSSSGSIGFFELLTIVFITLKLMDKIDWSWWWVLSPLWLPLTVVLTITAALWSITIIAVKLK